MKIHGKTSVWTLSVLLFVSAAGVGREQNQDAAKPATSAPPSSSAAPATIQGIPIDAKLLEPQITLNAFTNGPTVEVIVALATPKAHASTDFASKSSLSVLQSEIKVLQQKVVDNLPATGIKVGFKFDNISAFSAEVTVEGLQALQANPDVVAIEPVIKLEAHLAQGIALMHADTYRATHNGSGLSIAICDTGVDYSHARLGGGGFPNSKVLGGYDFGDSDSNPFPTNQAHGTCCAGIAAGNLGTVGDYIGGVAYNAKLYALKITPGSSGSASSAAMTAAWDWCVTHKNDNPSNPIMVISTSFGGGRYFSSCDGAVPSMTTAANNAVAAGITVFASSGNDGFCDSIAWPSCISSVVAVGAVYDANFGTYQPCVNAASCAPKIATGGCTTGFYVNDSTAPDKVTAYSNSSTNVALMGPANQCYTLDIVGASGYDPGDYFDSFGGTSAACPYAAGAAAALQSAAKAITGSYLSPAAVRSILIANGDNVTDTKVAITKPRVNLKKAIETLTAPPVFTIHPANKVVAVGGTATFTAAATGVPAVSYFWKRNGAIIPGATGTSYSLVNAQPLDSGAAFSCLASNTVGTTNSLSGILTVSSNFLSAVYVRSSVAGMPWNTADIEVAMTNVFGTWQDLRYETVNVNALFSPTNGFIYLEGSDDSAIEMGTFLTNNLVALQDWVSHGGSLFLNSAPNEGTNINFGFGVTLNYDLNNLIATVGAVNAAHPIFLGPFTPVGTAFSGNSFAHASASGGAITALLTNGTGRIVLGEKQYGAGHVVFGGMTIPRFHDPDPQGTNLLNNILAYAGSLAPGISNVVAVDSDHGWYDATGFASPVNPNYVSGHQGSSPTTTWHDWFVFNVPPFSGTVIGVDVLIKCYSNASPSGVETYELHHVATNIPTLVAGGSGHVNIYNDLANGPVYATRDIAAADAGTTVVIPLNAAGVSAVIAARAGQLAMGGVLTTLDAPTDDEYVFGYSGRSSTDVQIRLNFAGTNPPVIVTQPADLTVALEDTANFTILVNGSQPLNYQWKRNGVDIPGAVGSSYSIFNAQLTDSGALFSCQVSNLFGSVLSANARLTVSTNLNLRLAVYGAGGYNDDVVAKIRAALPYTEVNGFLINAPNPLPTLPQLLQYSAVLVYSDSPFNNSVALGNLLADYVDAGGGVVVNAFAFYSAGDYGVNGRFLTGGYSPFTYAGSAAVASLTLVADQPIHPLLSGVVSFNGGSSGYHNSAITPTPGSSLVAHWSNGQPLVGAKKITDGTVVGLNFYPPSSDARSDFWDATTGGGRLMANALLYAAQQTFMVRCAYLRSTVGLPWTSADNEAALTTVFGPNWTDLRYETVNVGALFAPTNDFIFMEGSDFGAIEMETFISNNVVAIQDWVSHGGSLFINSAPNEGGNANLGFGVTLRYSDSSSAVAAPNVSHPIFSGPYTPVGTAFTGSGFSHATVAGPGLLPLLTNNLTGRFALAEKGYGAGHIVFGGMTLPIFHDPDPQGTNLLRNILVYAASLWTSPAPEVIGMVDRGWYDSTGFHSPGNQNYFVGHISTTAYRDFFVFSIPPFIGSIDSATLRVKTYLVDSPSPFEHLRLSDVATPVATVIAGGSGLTGIFDDLANGAAYGDQDYFPSNSNSTIDIPLNAAFIAAATAARGSRVALGGSLTTIDVPASTEAVFSFSGNSATDAQLILTLGGTNPPVITTQPVSQTAPQGGVANFSVAASGSPTLTYQWRKNGVDISGATRTTYTITPVVTPDAANYTVRVTNEFGSAISAIAVLSVTPTNSETVLSNGNLVVRLNNLGGRISSILFRANELARVGTYISDWGLQTGTNGTTFVRNENDANTAGQPMALLSASQTYAAYSGIYTSGGANLAVNRTYQLVPGFDVMRITQGFVNNSPSGIVLRCFDTYDPDIFATGTNYYDMFADRYLLATNSLSIQMGRGSMSNIAMVMIMGTTEPAAVLAASSNYFGIESSTELNFFFGGLGADSDGALVDETLDIGREFYLAPGAGASFIFDESFATNIPLAEVGIIVDFYGQPYFVQGTAQKVGGQFQATLAGSAPSYQVLVSSNLVDWDVFTNLTMSYGTAQVVDPTPVTSPRFYRARLP